MPKDLRTFLDDVRRRNQNDIWMVDREIAPEYEAPAVIQRLYKERAYPIVQFNRVRGKDMPVIYNICADREKFAISLDTTKEAASEVYMERIQQRIDPVRVAEGPVQEIVFTGDEVDLNMLPIITHSEKDDAPYITLGVTCVEDQNGKMNMGIYRHRLIDRNHLGLYYSWGKRIQYIHSAAEERDEDLPIAIVIGMHPTFLYASIGASALAEDEYAICGGLMQEPLPVVPAKTVPIDVPAYAEIVIEGKLLAHRRRTEGPFGEYTDYYGQVVDAPVVEVTAITMRRDAIYNDIGMNVEHCYMTNAPREAQLLGLLRQAVPTVKHVHIPVSGTCFHAYISMKKHNEGDAKNLMMVAMGMDPFLKHVVVVDDDIDVFNEQEVLWAIATRFRADRDLFIVEGARGNRLDPTTYTITRLARDGMVTKIGIDATVPLGLPYELPERMIIPGVDEIDLEDYFPSSEQFRLRQSV